ncbi:PREDICTED: uncharacterized protein LOC108512907 [Rhinopithecus bieti]|uniref:uncharacterized protein LOC108512907 n=1 Tax=Rhinopithecus bieti TaxID=61621 RepID=UPI00083BA72A|nr:PREDICTED: uncharacterized protein LOC108512907 [Rhinopithecus bieti]
MGQGLQGHPRSAFPHPWSFAGICTWCWTATLHCCIIRDTKEPCPIGQLVTTLPIKLEASGKKTRQLCGLNIQNNASEFVDWYIPWIRSTSNHIIGAKDHASMQMNMARFTSYHHGPSDHSLRGLPALHNYLEHSFPPPHPDRLFVEGPAEARSKVKASSGSQEDEGSRRKTTLEGPSLNRKPSAASFHEKSEVGAGDDWEEVTSRVVRQERSELRCLSPGHPRCMVGAPSLLLAAAPAAAAGHPQCLEGGMPRDTAESFLGGSPHRPPLGQEQQILQQRWSALNL